MNIFHENNEIKDGGNSSIKNNCPLDGKYVSSNIVNQDKTNLIPT